MKILNFLIVTIFLFINLNGQQTLGYIIDGDVTCDCEIMIEPILDPSLPPELSVSDVHGRVLGDLDSFEKTINGQCYQSVNVTKRSIVSNQIQFVPITLANSLQELLEVYRDRSSICLNGYFVVRNTITVGDDKIIKLLGNTLITYQGGGVQPAISFEGNNSSIQGGEIRTDVPMNDGLIKISSDGIQSANSIHIKDITLTSVHDNIFGPNADARDDRAIHMANPFESIITQRDFSTNFFAQITNVDITGFAVGMHLRGWSNAASVRDIRFSDIGGYGLWVSGCVDNSFADLTFNNCPSANAIRLDNYVDERFQGFELGGQFISVSDPNERAQILTDEVLSELLPNNSPLIPQIFDDLNRAEQTNFNTMLDDLIKNDEGNTNADPSLFYSILEACGSNTNINRLPFANLIDIDNNVTKIGLKGYYDDDITLYNNYPPDQLNVTRIPNLTGNTGSDISLYKTNFDHPTEFPILPVQLEEATCLESFGSTMFFKRAALNIFSRVNVKNDLGDNQVAAVVELRGREDDSDLCMENLMPDENGVIPPCSNCRYEVRSIGGEINSRVTSGFQNAVYACDLSGINRIVNNTQTATLDRCPLTENIIKVVEQ